MDTDQAAVPAPAAVDVIKAVVDGEDTLFLPVEVSEALAAILTDQRERLDTVHATGRDRYRAAREAGCPASVAKGAKDRTLKPNEIYIPRTEIHRSGNAVRISALKTTLQNIPDGDVTGVVFTRDADGNWSGKLEAKQTVEVAS